MIIEEYKVSLLEIETALDLVDNNKMLSTYYASKPNVSLDLVEGALEFLNNKIEINLEEDFDETEDSDDIAIDLGEEEDDLEEDDLEEDEDNIDIDLEDEDDIEDSDIIDNDLEEDDEIDIDLEEDEDDIEDSNEIDIDLEDDLEDDIYNNKEEEDDEIDIDLEDDGLEDTVDIELDNEEDDLDDGEDIDINLEEEDDDIDIDLEEEDEIDVDLEEDKIVIPDSKKNELIEDSAENKSKNTLERVKEVNNSSSQTPKSEDSKIVYMENTSKNVDPVSSTINVKQLNLNNDKLNVASVTGDVNRVNNINQVVSVKKRNYDSLSTDKLYNFVALYMKKHGVKDSGVSKTLLTEEFGANNIKKLINKSYLIQLYDGTLTFNR